ncbi:hypothetical protein ACHAXR_009812 [Thalassiosira sp. AJA248-18]
MPLLGFELQDVLRVVVGIALGLLTVYRRELSCNRGYHPDDEDDELLGDNSYHRWSLERRTIPRTNSSSALPSMTPPHHDDELDTSTHRALRRATLTSFGPPKSNDDPTEELLDSAGLFLSGGPFLAAAIAVFDHLVFTIFISTWTGVSSIRHEFERRSDRRNWEEWQRASRLEASESSHDSDTEVKQPQNEQQHLYSVAWNAATEYFTSKLDGRSSGASQRDRIDADWRRSRMPHSKSTGNLKEHLPDERSRALFREMIVMANKGCMDVTLLPSDAQISIFSYLPPEDVLAFTCTNRAGRNLLEEVDAVHADDDIEVHDKEDGDTTALLIWKALFQRDYSWVLSDWKIGREAFLRSMAHDASQRLLNQQQQQQDHSSSKSCKVLRHLISTLHDSEHVTNDYLHVDNIMQAASSSSSIHTALSMKDFYFTFCETWLNYTIAGCNSTEKCLIGLHGHVFDISNFVEDHPGSTETLLLQAGQDATVFFESMGHSSVARKLALGMCAVVNAQCTRCHFTEGERSDTSFQLKAGVLGPLYSTCGLIKPNCRSLDIKRNIMGFLIPRKRSKPRFQGGLHRIRERIREEEEAQLINAAQWGSEAIGPDGMFGGVHVYHDPFRGWRWWYTDRDFNSVFTMPPS